MTTTNRKENNSIRIDEKIKGLYKILAANSKQIDQESWTLDQEISWATLNEYLGLNVVPGEVIPYETCMKVIGGFITIGPDWDDVPKKGLCLMELVETIKNHIIPTTRNLTMKNEYSFSSFDSLANNGQKHYLSGGDIKGVHLKVNGLGGPNDNGQVQLGQGVGNHQPGFNYKAVVPNIDDECRAPKHRQYTLSSFTGSNYNAILDMYPDVIYSEEQLAQYTIRPWLTPEESAEAGITVRLDGIILHPRHWRYAAGNGLIVFMDNKIDSDRVEVDFDVLSGSIALRFLPKWMREGKNNLSEPSTYAYMLSTKYLELLQADIDAGTMKVCIVEPCVSPSATEWRSAIKKLLSENGKVMVVDSLSGNNGDSKIAISGRGMTKHILKYGISGGIPIGGIDMFSSYTDSMTTCREFDTYSFESGVPEAVKGNSRQKIIDNGKISWPAAKSRKGNRKIK